MAKEIVLTGLRANDELTLGNYLGAMLPMINFANAKANDYQIQMFMPDLHTITVEVDYSNLQEHIAHCFRQYIAAGLNIEHNNIYIYRQSYISAHAELAWILECFTGFGEASRMVEFKDKSKLFGADRVSAGLFNYPMLMAADILIYGAKWVPVGDDQRQHLEMARTLAERLNNKFGELFIVPESIEKQTSFFGIEAPVRIRSLRNPLKKMSKSVSDPTGTILLVDKPDEAAKKIMSATTDSIGKITYDFESQPGVSNLLQILALLIGKPQKEVNDLWIGKSSYGELKKTVAEAVESFLSDFQYKYSKVNQSAIQNELEASEEVMNRTADALLFNVQQAVGLRPTK